MEVRIGPIRRYLNKRLKIVHQLAMQSSGFGAFQRERQHKSQQGEEWCVSFWEAAVTVTQVGDFKQWKCILPYDPEALRVGGLHAPLLTSGGGQMQSLASLNFTLSVLTPPPVSSSSACHWILGPSLNPG